MKTELSLFERHSQENKSNHWVARNLVQVHRRKIISQMYQDPPQLKDKMTTGVSCDWARGLHGHLKNTETGNEDLKRGGAASVSRETRVERSTLRSLTGCQSKADPSVDPSAAWPLWKSHALKS